MPDPLAYLFGLEQFGIKFGLENISRARRAPRPSRARVPIRARRRHQRQGIGHGDGRRRAPRRRPSLGALHLAAPRRPQRAVRHRRPPGRRRRAASTRSRDVRGAIDALRATARSTSQPTFFEVTTAVGVRAVPARRRSRSPSSRSASAAGSTRPTSSRPSATAITSIALRSPAVPRHDAAATIAREKAGIIKPGVPVVVGALDAGGAARRSTEIARERRRGASIRADERALATYGDAPLGAARRASARATPPSPCGCSRLLDARGIAVPRDGDARPGCATVSWPGRLDLRRFADGREVLLDAAHNPAGAAALASYLRETWPDEQPPLVFAAMRDKDVARHVRGAAAGGRRARRDARVESRARPIPTMLAAQARDGRAGAADRRRAVARRRARRRLARVAAHRRRRIDFSARRRDEGVRRDVIPFEDVTPDAESFPSCCCLIVAVRVRRVRARAAPQAAAPAPTPSAQSQIQTQSSDSLERHRREAHQAASATSRSTLADGTSIYADDAELFEDEDRAIATGNVRLLAGRRTASRPSAPTSTPKTRLGTFYNACGHRDRQAAEAQPARPGARRAAAGQPARTTIVYFFGDTVEKVGPKKYKITNGGFIDLRAADAALGPARRHGDPERRSLHAAEERGPEREGRADVLPADPVLPDQEGRPRDRLPDSDLRHRRRCAASRSTTRSSGRSTAARTRRSCTTGSRRSARASAASTATTSAAASNGNITRATISISTRRPTRRRTARRRLPGERSYEIRGSAEPGAAAAACARARSVDYFSSIADARRRSTPTSTTPRATSARSAATSSAPGARYSLNATFDHSEYFYNADRRRRCPAAGRGSR